MVLFKAHRTAQNRSKSGRDYDNLGSNLVEVYFGKGKSHKYPRTILYFLLFLLFNYLQTTKIAFTINFVVVSYHKIDRKLLQNWSEGQF